MNEVTTPPTVNYLTDKTFKTMLKSFSLFPQGNTFSSFMIPAVALKEHSSLMEFATAKTTPRQSKSYFQAMAGFHAKAGIPVAVEGYSSKLEKKFPKDQIRFVPKAQAINFVLSCSKRSSIYSIVDHVSQLASDQYRALLLDATTSTDYNKNLLTLIKTVDEILHENSKAKTTLQDFYSYASSVIRSDDMKPFSQLYLDSFVLGDQQQREKAHSLAKDHLTTSLNIYFYENGLPFKNIEYV